MITTGPRSIDDFLAAYPPEIAAGLRQARAHLATHFPRGFELVYDHYNALVFAFAPSARASEAILSVAGYPKWITLFFQHGISLPDPQKILEGAGVRVRGVRLEPPQRLLEPAVQALIEAAKAGSAAALAAAPPRSTLIKSISPKQRPRRPAVKATGTGRREAATR